MTANEMMSYFKEHPEAIAQGQQNLQEVMRRASVDAEFRKQLIANPHEALYEVTGNQIPKSANIVFVENKADVTVVLPPYQDANAELSEEELEAVAGGITPVLSIIASIESILASIGYIVND